MYSVSYTNPYYTDDGISRGFDIFKRKTNAATQCIPANTIRRPMAVA